MATDADPRAPFDDAVLADAAAGSDLSVDDLGALVDDLYALLDGYPGVGGVDGLVHEWRRAFREDPLVAREEGTYYLAVPVRVWDDVVGRLDLTDEERVALGRVHARQFDADRDEDAGDARPLVLSG